MDSFTNNQITKIRIQIIFKIVLKLLVQLTQVGIHACPRSIRIGGYCATLGGENLVINEISP